MITPQLPVSALSPFERLNQMMEELFPGAPTLVAKNWMPPVDIKETDKDLILMAEIPAMLRENIDVELVGDSLVIKGKRTEEKSEEREGYLRRERMYGSFQRAFKLDVPVEPDKIVADYKDGLLVVTVPKAEALKPKRIEIKNR